MVMIRGRGQFVTAGSGKVYPEEIKEGIYHNPELARLTTGNFRLGSGKFKAKLRIQLSPGVEPGDTVTKVFCEAISNYAMSPIDVSPEQFDSFGSGMSVNYEEKFDYLGSQTMDRIESLIGRES